MTQQNLNYRQYVNTILQAPNKQYPERTFLLKQLLGEGGEGGVYLANPSKWGTNTTPIVLKLQTKMKSQEIDFIDNLKSYQDQYEIPNTPLYHPSQIIKIYERFQWRTFEVLLMEKGEEDLFTYIQNNSSKMTLQEKVNICQQVTQPIFFLSQQQLLHRDIKSDNYVKVGNVFKLIDFGLVQTSQQSKTQGIGSMLYQAPELHDKASSTPATDVWALGCLFYEILAGLSVFQKNAEMSVNQITLTIRDNIKNQTFFDQKINQLQIPEEFKKIILKMLVCDEKKRTNLQEINEFFKTFKLNAPIRQTDVFMTAFPVAQNQATQRPFQTAINYQEQITQQQQILVQTQQDLTSYLNQHYSDTQTLCKQLPSYLTYLQSYFAYFSQQQFATEQQMIQLDQYFDQAQTLQFLECSRQIQYLGSQTKKYLYHQELLNKFQSQQQTQQLQQQYTSQGFQLQQKNTQIFQQSSQIAQLTKQINDQNAAFKQYAFENQKLKNDIAALLKIQPTMPQKPFLAPIPNSAVNNSQTIIQQSDFDSKINKSGEIEQEKNQFEKKNESEIQENQGKEEEQNNQAQESQNEQHDESKEEKY